MEDDLVKAIQELCISRGWTLSLAESCTGGHLAARLTRMPGCSRYFLGAMIAYSNAVKVKLLGVDPQVLAEYGPASGPVVGQMAEGILKLTGSDYSLATSGIAGPAGGTPETPVGTIWVAIASLGEGTKIWNFHLSGSRREIIERSVEILLTEFSTFIQNKNPQ
jgi:PncC family amidohydrolase